MRQPPARMHGHHVWSSAWKVVQKLRGKFLFCALFLLAYLAKAGTFTNPIAASGQDPWVIQWHDNYYYCYSTGRGICISRAARLQDIATEPATTIWTAQPGQPYSKEIWAPELHFLRGRWYVYFAADDGENKNHRMYVLESASDNPFGEYSLRGKITDPSDCWAIDGTVLDYAGQLYFIWSGWPDTLGKQQNLYIATMSDPYTISGERVLISQPLKAWERHGGPPYINEGPEVLQHDGATFVIYSASGSWTDDYCLGQLQLSGTDPLSASAWVKSPDPVFSRTATVFGPGHASFVKSPDQTEDWIVYHAAITSGSGWKRNVRIQLFTWNSDGTPKFDFPLATDIVLPEPSDNPSSATLDHSTVGN